MICESLVESLSLKTDLLVISLKGKNQRTEKKRERRKYINSVGGRGYQIYEAFSP